MLIDLLLASHTSSEPPMFRPTDPQVSLLENQPHAERTGPNARAKPERSEVPVLSAVERNDYSGAIPQHKKPKRVELRTERAVASVNRMGRGLWVRANRATDEA